MHGGDISPQSTHVNDILCGNGKRYRKTQGNEMYHHLVRAFVDTYAKQENRKDKTRITKSIVEAVRMAKPPGRFLNMGKNGIFYEIGDKKAWVKTGQLLRDLVLEKKRKIGANNAEASITISKCISTPMIPAPQVQAPYAYAPTQVAYDCHGSKNQMLQQQYAVYDGRGTVYKH